MDVKTVERVWAEVEAWGPEVLVFDVGQVLVRWDPMRPYLDLLPDAAAREAFRGRVGLDAMNLEGDRGRLDEAVALWAARHPADAALIRAWRARWAEMFGPAIPEAAELMRRARAAGLTVAALSNFAADTWELAREGFPVLRVFDVEVISGREGVVKPEPEIYALMEARTGVSGRGLFFLDDRAENVAGARARGWGGLVWT
ncbi:MAG: HAD-IA family hydrolase [Paracoccaceae bacterium]